MQRLQETSSRVRPIADELSGVDARSRDYSEVYKGPSNDPRLQQRALLVPLEHSYVLYPLSQAMKTLSVLVALAIAASATAQRTFTVYNGCPFTMW